jgi:hypothetical protein
MASYKFKATENECYIRLLCMVIVRAIADVKMEKSDTNERERKDALKFLKSERCKYFVEMICTFYSLPNNGIEQGLESICNMYKTISMN